MLLKAEHVLACEDGLWQLLLGLALRPWWSASPCRPRSSVHPPPATSSPMSFAGFVPCLC